MCFRGDWVDWVFWRLWRTSIIPKSEEESFGGEGGGLGAAEGVRGGEATSRVRMIYEFSVPSLRSQLCYARLTFSNIRSQRLPLLNPLLQFHLQMHPYLVHLISALNRYRVSDQLSHIFFTYQLS